MERILDFLGWPKEPVEQKTTVEDIRQAIAAEGSQSYSGKIVTPRQALEVTTVLACVRAIAEGVAQVPWKLYRRSETGGREEARDHPLFDLLHRRPNEWQTSFEFRETIAMHVVLTGNAFVFINRRANGEIAELLPYEPGSVTIHRATDGTLTYSVNLAGGGNVTLGASEMWHLRGPSWNAYSGLSAVTLTRNAIGLAMATEEFGSALFKNGARPGGLLTTEQALDAAKAKQLRDAWNETMQGSGNAMKTGVLTSGMKYQQLSYNADEAQFNETRVQAQRDICAAFRVNPIMAQIPGAAGAYDNGEQMFIAHVVHTLMPWYERIEQSAENALLSKRDRDAGLYTKLEAKGLMRGTAKERAEFNQIMLQNGVFSRNEVRESEDMDVIADPEFSTPRPAANLYGPTVPQG